jgi:hypothetical protein
MTAIRSLNQMIAAGCPWPLGVQKLETEDAAETNPTKPRTGQKAK